MVSNPDVTYYGWIPILTSRVIASKKLKEGDVFVRVFRDLYPKEKLTITLNEFDSKGFLSSFEVKIPKKYNIDIESIKVECKIEPSGLTSFSFPIPNFKESPKKESPKRYEIFKKIFKNKLAINIFDFVRDLYHEHVHHEKKDDATLKPVEAKTEDEAIEGILNQYLDKVIYYHKDIGSKKGNILIRFLLHTRKRINFLASGMGELVYAQSFVSLHKNNRIANWEENIKCFLRASSSLKILRDKLDESIMFALSLIMIFLTMLSVLMASGKIKALLMGAGKIIKAIIFFIWRLLAL